MRPCVLLTIALTCFSQALDAGKPSRLVPYTRCTYSGGLTSISVDRAPNLPMARPVETAEGKKRVSVADGYRVMLAFPKTDPFVNLKIESSEAGRYAGDKQTVLEGMQHLSVNARGVAVNLERSVVRGIDVAALNNPGLDSGVISFYSFFSDKEGIIATAYILNQLPERRAFKDMTQYRALRDRFVEEFVACMSSSGRG